MGAIEFAFDVGDYLFGAWDIECTFGMDEIVEHIDDK